MQQNLPSRYIYCGRRQRRPTVQKGIDSHNRSLQMTIKTTALAMYVSQCQQSGFRVLASYASVSVVDGLARFTDGRCGIGIIVYSGAVLSVVKKKQQLRLPKLRTREKDLRTRTGLLLTYTMFICKAHVQSDTKVCTQKITRRLTQSPNVQGAAQKSSPCNFFAVFSALA